MEEFQMRRANVVAGWILMVLGLILLSFFYTSLVTDRWYSGPKPTMPASYYLVCLFLMIFWYFLNGFHMIKEWNRRPVLRFGRYIDTKGPGFCFIEPLLNTTLPDIPVRDVVLEVDPKRTIQTMDNLGVEFIGVITLCVDEKRVKDSVVNVEDVFKSTEMRALSTMTNETGKVDLDHMLENRDTFCQTMVTALIEKVSAWGVTIKAFEMRGFKIADPAIEQAISKKAKAQKEGEAELARAHMQEQVAKALDAAAQSFSPEGWRLKGLEALIELAQSAQNNTIILSSDVVSSIGQALPQITKTLPDLAEAA
jgi:regulator of protease activity HflC (stomatin/prohibitin superfamily)